MDILKFKCIIFDLDGTLIDSEHIWRKIDEKFFSDHGLTLTSDYCRKISTMNFLSAAEYTKEVYSLDMSVKEIIQEWYDFALNEYSHNIHIFPYVKQFLEYLKNNGIKIALATASTDKLYTAVLKNNNVYDYFDTFVSTEQVKRGKGYPDVYEFACSSLGFEPSECAVFEDIIEGIRGAEAGGFATVACCVKNHFAEDIECMKNEADFYFSDYSELI